MHYAGQDPDPDNVLFESVKKGSGSGCTMYNTALNVIL